MFLSGGRSERNPNRDANVGSGAPGATASREGGASISRLSFLPSIRGHRSGGASAAANHSVAAAAGRGGNPEVTRTAHVRLPGFRFVPTDEELVVRYLLPRAAHSDTRVRELYGGSIAGENEAERRAREQLIPEHDALSTEPWELPDACQVGDSEWFFFSEPSPCAGHSNRTNRCTEAGFWKSTGLDEVIEVNAGAAFLMGDEEPAGGAGAEEEDKEEEEEEEEYAVTMADRSTGDGDAADDADDEEGAVRFTCRPSLPHQLRRGLSRSRQWVAHGGAMLGLRGEGHAGGARGGQPHAGSGSGGGSGDHRRSLHPRETHVLVGRRKKLVFYMRKAKGCTLSASELRTNFVMHEYRLEWRERGAAASASSKQQHVGCVVLCRVFSKEDRVCVQMQHRMRMRAPVLAAAAMAAAGPRPERPPQGSVPGGSSPPFFNPRAANGPMARRAAGQAGAARGAAGRKAGPTLPAARAQEDAEEEDDEEEEEYVEVGEEDDDAAQAAAATTVAPAPASQPACAVQQPAGSACASESWLQRLAGSLIPLAAAEEPPAGCAVAGAASGDKAAAWEQGLESEHQGGGTGGAAAAAWPNAGAAAGAGFLAGAPASAPAAPSPPLSAAPSPPPPAPQDLSAVASTVVGSAAAALLTGICDSLFYPPSPLSSPDYYAGTTASSSPSLTPDYYSSDGLSASPSPPHKLLLSSFPALPGGPSLSSPEEFYRLPSSSSFADEDMPSFMELPAFWEAQLPGPAHSRVAPAPWEERREALGFALTATAPGLEGEQQQAAAGGSLCGMNKVAQLTEGHQEPCVAEEQQQQPPGTVAEILAATAVAFSGSSAAAASLSPACAAATCLGSEESLQASGGRGTPPFAPQAAATPPFSLPSPEVPAFGSTFVFDATDETLGSAGAGEGAVQPLGAPVLHVTGLGLGPVSSPCLSAPAPLPSCPPAAHVVAGSCSRGTAADASPFLPAESPPDYLAPLASPCKSAEGRPPGSPIAACAGRGRGRAMGLGSTVWEAAGEGGQAGAGLQELGGPSGFETEPPDKWRDRRYEGGGRRCEEWLSVGPLGGLESNAPVHPMHAAEWPEEESADKQGPEGAPLPCGATAPKAPPLSLGPQPHQLAALPAHLQTQEAGRQAGQQQSSWQQQQQQPPREEGPLPLSPLEVLAEGLWPEEIACGLPSPQAPLCLPPEAQEEEMVREVLGILHPASSASSCQGGGTGTTGAAAAVLEQATGGRWVLEAEAGAAATATAAAAAVAVALAAPSATPRGSQPSSSSPLWAAGAWSSSGGPPAAALSSEGGSGHTLPAAGSAGTAASCVAAPPCAANAAGAAAAATLGPAAGSTGQAIYDGTLGAADACTQQWAGECAGRLPACLPCVPGCAAAGGAGREGQWADERGGPPSGPQLQARAGHTHAGPLRQSAGGGGGGSSCPQGGSVAPSQGLLPPAAGARGSKRKRRARSASGVGPELKRWCAGEGGNPGMGGLCGPAAAWALAGGAAASAAPGAPLWDLGNPDPPGPGPAELCWGGQQGQQGHQGQWRSGPVGGGQGKLGAVVGSGRNVGAQAVALGAAVRNLPTEHVRARRGVSVDSGREIAFGLGMPSGPLVGPESVAVGSWGPARETPESKEPSLEDLMMFVRKKVRESVQEQEG